MRICRIQQRNCRSEVENSGRQRHNTLWHNMYPVPSRSVLLPKVLVDCKMQTGELAAAEKVSIFSCELDLDAKVAIKGVQ